MNLQRQMRLPKLNGRALTLVASVALAIGGSSALQSAETSNLSVTASVTANCSITTAPVAFGAYDPVTTNATTDLDSTGTISVTCTDDAATTITLDEGGTPDTGSTPAAPERRLYDGVANYLSYELFSDTLRADVWGADATSDFEYEGTGTLEVLTVYGTIPAGQNVPAGNYTDTVLATITF